MGNQERSKTSSYFTSPYSLAVLVFLTCICAYYGMHLLFGYLLFLSLLSMTAFVWGQYSISGLTVDLQAQSYQVYPGQTLEMHCTLGNQKCLPLMWLEWAQPYPMNGCLQSPEDFQVRQEVDPSDETKVNTVLCKRFSLVKWYATVQWTAQFQAVRRGVYAPQNIALQTGDGFGLSIKQTQCQLSTPPMFVVYPQRVAVSTGVFFKHVWSASTGPHGVIEDVTVLRGTRDYQQSDSFKRINWRLAARTGELSVNLYETIAPRSVYFFVDTATFFDCGQDNEIFEDTLSVVGSLIEELFALGMSVGLYLPEATHNGATWKELESTTLEDCLLALSLCDCDNPEAQFSRQSISHLLSTQSGMIYYVCRDVSQGRFTALFEEVGIGQFSVITYEKDEGKTDIDGGAMAVYGLSEFKRSEV